MTEEERKAKAEELLIAAYAKQQMEPVFEGGGFFCRRDSVARDLIMELLVDNNVGEVTVAP